MEIENLKRILRINSEEQAAVAGCPFGIESAKCLEEMLKIGQEMGFEVKNVDNYGGHIQWTSDNPDAKLMGIFGHLDVVPAGDKWDEDPYGAIVKDGYLYGRGTTDDKGPMMACLEAMKELKDEGFMPKHHIRMILGCDEETKWKGVDYYFSRESHPDFGFTPDAEFPIINGEKGIIHLWIAKKLAKSQIKGLELRSLKGGTVVNAVAASSRAVVKSDKGYDKVKALIDQFKLDTGYKVNYKQVGKSLEIVTTGIAAHGAKPECGLNAISIMMSLLGRMNFVNEDVNDFVQFYNDHIGLETNGIGMGLDMEDEASGKLSLNIGVIDLDSESGKFSMDIRFPVTKTSQEIYDIVSQTVDKYDLGIMVSKRSEPIYFEKDMPLIKDLLDIYKKHTQDKDAEPITIGGGTYARATKGIVAFGAQLCDEPDVMHQVNERVSLKALDKIFEIYKDAIKTLSSGDY